MLGKHRVSVATVALTVLIVGLTAVQAQGPKEGIQVHGHWVFEVINPDGTLVSRREFDNALDEPGKVSLIHLLAGSSRVGEWFIKLNGPTAPESPFWTNRYSGEFDGYIMQTNGQAWIDGDFTFRTLTIDPPTAGGLVLRASAEARQRGVVTEVATYTYTCGIPECGRINPGTYQLHKFSKKTVEPQTLEARQILQVTVTFTFS